MLLQAVRIQNYRSLEDVSLDGLSEFNVLIGRNNAGKSSVFGVLSHLAAHFFRIGATLPQDQFILTDHDESRQHAVAVTLAPNASEREEFIGLLISEGLPEERRQALIDSAIMRQINYEFLAQRGQPWNLELVNVQFRAEDNEWAPLLTAFGPDGPPNRVHPPRHYTFREATTKGSLATITADRVRASPTSKIELKISDLNVARDYSRHSSTWALSVIREAFSRMFFFSAYRRAADSLRAQNKDHLAPDGSDLATVLNTLVSGGRMKFQVIERFIEQAVPDLGLLQPKFVGDDPRDPGDQTVHVSFERGSGDSIQLWEMGDGVKELLMAATVMATEGSAATLFLEEPESHLHPGAQRFMAERLRANVNQVFVTTHSATFLNVPPPRSVFRVSLVEGRTRIQRLGGTESLAAALEEIEARNSDVLLSDAVLFVEGPSDRDVFHAWSRELGESFEESNITVLPMGGGAKAARHAPARSDVLVGISEEARIPHLFVLDRDERRVAEIAHLQSQLGERLIVFTRREIENYLLSPDAILAAIREKHRDDLTIRNRIDAATHADVEDAINIAANGLFGVVLLKRIRAEVGGLADGLLTRGEVNRLAGHAHDDDLPELVLNSIGSTMAKKLEGIDLRALVDAERAQLEREWADLSNHVSLAPGEEVLSQVFAKFGSTFSKRKDTVRIAAAMQSDEIPDEVKRIVHLARALSPTVVK